MEDKNDLASGFNQEILLKELVGRRQALSEIRNTAYKIVAAVAAAGITLFWLLLTERQLTVIQTIFLSLFVIILTFFVYVFLTSLHKGFQNNREIMVKLENCLGLYENRLLPEDFKSTQVRRSDFLSMTKLFVLFISDRKACLGSWLDILKIMKTGKGFPDFAEKIIDPFIAWQLYYDTFGKPPAWGERMHGFSGEVEAIVDHLSSIWNLSPERLSRMLFEYKPKKRKKCFCGSKKQFRYCHGKYFYPIRSKITTIKEMTPDECKRNFVKEEMILLKTILELPSLPNVLY